jgi:hypothetical protein
LFAFWAIAFRWLIDVPPAGLQPAA